MSNRFQIEEAVNGWVVTVNDQPGLCRSPENTFVFTDGWELAEYLMKCQRRTKTLAQARVPVRP